MFLDARQLVDSSLEADVCIAGGGAAGMTLAMDLRASGLSVIVLESGGFRREAETQQLSDGRMIGLDTWNLRSMRIRALGGATGHWEGWCRPLMPYDFDAREYVPNSGWPITYTDLMPWYQRACQTLEIGAFAWNAAARAKATGTVLPSTGPSIEYRYYQYSPPTRFARTYGALLEKAEDVRVIAHANLVDIRLDPTRSRVESFACRTLEKNDFRINANRYVLALGGIENARVLLASRSQQLEGVANGRGNVGRYFMEHPHYYASASVVHSPKLDLTFFRRRPSDLTRANGTPVPVMGAIALSAGVLQRERLLNFAATFQAAGEKAETGNLSAGEIQGVVTRGRFPHQWSQLSIRTEQSPQADSRITLLDETDALGMPRVALDWRIAEDDDIQLHRALTLLGRELGAADIARLWIPGDGKKIVLRPSPGGHHMGTTRMGLDPASSVVNADCRTHDINNLFIAGSSVFPTGGEANPTLTIVALAHRLAATLKKAQ